MSNFRKINSCEVCGNLKVEKVLDLGSHVLCDNLMQIGDISTAEKYPIQVLFCNKCFTAGLIAFSASFIFPILTSFIHLFTLLI